MVVNEGVVLMINFFKILKKHTLFLLLTILIIPQSILSYSDYIIASGETVGIKLNTEGILIVGSYEINGHNPLKEANLNEGDIITHINNKKISSIEELVNFIENCDCNNINIKYLRNSKQGTTSLKLYEDQGTLKTGLYVKDTISGVGTLTYIDPETKLFGVLGHEIIDSATGDIVSIKSGNIFDSKITSITRSTKGNPGEKNAILYSDKVTGNIKENTKKGIFGEYVGNYQNERLYKVGKIDDINIGNAKILTVIRDNKIEEFDIKILSIKETDDKLKNIEFEITDESLLEATNGIVQGMSGSPIIQNDYIIGAVTHVVVNDPHKGYGIFIVNMLEEGEN